MNGIVEERNLQCLKDRNNFHQNNIRKAVITAVYHTCYTKFFYLLLDNDSNSSFYKLWKIIGTCESAVFNHGYNILRLFDVLPNFPPTTSEKKCDY